MNDDVFTTSRLILPNNYTTNGKKVPIILWLTGSGSFVKWHLDFGELYAKGLEYLKAEGFAIFSVFAWGNNYINKYPNCGQAYPYPVPTNLECIKKGIEFICDRFNVDYENIHIMGHSQGGQCSLYYASRQDFPIRSIGMFSPVLDYISMYGDALYADTRKALAEELNMHGDIEYYGSTNFSTYSNDGKTFFRNNETVLCGFNESFTNLIGGTSKSRIEDALTDGEKFWTEKIWEHEEKENEIYTHKEYAKIGSVPVKIWGAYDDNQTPYLKMVEVVEQLKNGGSEASLRTFPVGSSTGGHYCAINKNTVESVTTRLGINVENVPIAWVENVEFIRSHMAK